MVSFLLQSKTLSFQHKPPAALWRKPWESLGTAVPYRTLAPFLKMQSQGRKKKQADRRVEVKNLTESTQVLPWVLEECFPILWYISMQQ